MSAEPILLLVYVSSATVLFDQPMLVELLRVSRANNARDGITGVLLYDDGSFIQAIEGPEPAIRALKRRLEADPRHQQVTTVLEELVAERQFGQWSMGFVPREALDAADLDAFTHFLEHPDSLAIDGPARRLVQIVLDQFRRSLR